MISQVMNNGNMTQIANGILSYAADKLNVREGDPLFLLPRISDVRTLLKPALLKREPEWWLGNELNRMHKSENEPALEIFMFEKL
jgi:hypothetical protein